MATANGLPVCSRPDGLTTKWKGTKNLFLTQRDIIDVTQDTTVPLKNQTVSVIRLAARMYFINVIPILTCFGSHRSIHAVYNSRLFQFKIFIVFSTISVCASFEAIYHHPHLNVSKFLSSTALLQVLLIWHFFSTDRITVPSSQCICFVVKT